MANWKDMFRVTRNQLIFTLFSAPLVFVAVYVLLALVPEGK